MAITVLVNGAFGRMGQMVTEAVRAHPTLELVGQIGREYDLKKSIIDSKAQVVVDFTHPSAVLQNTKMILEAGAHPVIGTSGLTKEEIVTLQKLAAEKKLGGLIAANFSLGAVLMMKYAKEIVRYMPNVEIIEKHHEMKVDSPSGTAMRSVDMMLEAGVVVNPDIESNPENVRGARGGNYHGVPIHAVRLPGFLAHQEIIFGSLGETLTLKHDSIDRQCFMPGVCLACEKVVQLDHLVNGLDRLLN